VYLDKTVPLLEYYAAREWTFTVDGAQPPDAVHEDIVACLQGWALGANRHHVRSWRMSG